MKFRHLVAAFAATLAISPVAMAQGYPNKTVKIIVPYQPGQGTDVATRFLADHLTKATGQTFYVENKAGAGGNIGTAEAARATPDGYTLLMGTNGTHVLNQYMYPAMAFDPDKDFEAVMLVSTFPMVVLATASSPYHSLTEVLAAAKAKPDSVDVALPSTTARLVLELMNQQSASIVRAIPYKGSSTSMTDLLGGQIPLAIDTVSASRSFISAGKVKALAITSLKESALLPGVKPVAEQGVAGFQVVAWNGLYAPAGTPPAVVQRLNAELTKVLAVPEVRARLLELGHEPAGGSGAELTSFARSERVKWAPLIAKAGLKAQ